MGRQRQFATATEGRWLTGTDDHTLHVAFPQPPAENGEFGDRGIGEHIHRTARHVENKMQDIVFAAFSPELLQLSQLVHGLPPRCHISPYSISYICVLVQTDGS